MLISNSGKNRKILPTLPSGPRANFPAFQVRSLQLDNRIAVPPSCQYSAEEGKAAEWHMIHLLYLALSGTGLMILETCTRARC